MILTAQYTFSSDLSGRVFNVREWTDPTLHIDGVPLARIEPAENHPECVQHTAAWITAYVLVRTSIAFSEDGSHDIERWDRSVLLGGPQNVSRALAADVDGHAVRVESAEGGVVGRRTEVHVVFACKHRAPLT